MRGTFHLVSYWKVWGRGGLRALFRKGDPAWWTVAGMPARDDCWQPASPEHPSALTDPQSGQHKRGPPSIPQVEDWLGYLSGKFFTQIILVRPEAMTLKGSCHLRGLHLLNKRPALSGRGESKISSTYQGTTGCSGETVLKDAKLAVTGIFISSMWLLTKKTVEQFMFHKALARPESHWTVKTVIPCGSQSRRVSCSRWDTSFEAAKPQVSSGAEAHTPLLWLTACCFLHQIMFPDSSF